MATKKQTQMAEFYLSCLAKGYTDMTDDNMQLKAKVVATDLKLNYGKDIVRFFESAKTCYELVENEKKEKEEKEKKLKEEMAIKSAMKSNRLLVLENNSHKITVYIREDNSIYHTFDGGPHLEGAPEIAVRDSKVYQSTYHPSKAVYTGATVGGITTGGIHYTQPSYSEKVSGTGNGYVTAKARGQEKAIDLRKATVTDNIARKYKHHGNFKMVFPNNKTCLCYDETGDKAFSDTKNMLAGKSAMEVMNTVSIMKDFSCLDIRKCQIISDVLHSIANATFPPTDEEMYHEAMKLSSATDSKILKTALLIFNEISYFEDSKARAKEVNKKYEEAIQREKEEAILRKENNQRKIKKFGIIGAIALVVIIAITLAINFVLVNAENSSMYNEAMQLLEENNFDEAEDLFRELKSFKNSEDMLSESKYRKGMHLLEKKEYEDAELIFEYLEEYKDSPTMTKECKYQGALEALNDGLYYSAKRMFDELGDYKDSTEQYKEAVYLDAKENSEKGDLDYAGREFAKIPGYKDADTYLSGLSPLAISLEINDNFMRNIEIEYDENGKIISAQSEKYSSETYKFTFNENGILTGAVLYGEFGTDNFTIEYLENGTSILHKNGTPKLLFDKYGNVYSYFSKDDTEPATLSGYAVDEQNNATTNNTINEYDEEGNLSKVTYYSGNTVGHYYLDSLEIDYIYKPCQDDYKEISRNNVRMMFHIVIER